MVVAVSCNNLFFGGSIIGRNCGEKMIDNTCMESFFYFMRKKIAILYCTFNFLVISHRS